LFVAGVHDAERPALEQVVEAEHIVARKAENMTHPVGVEALDEVTADGRGGLHADGGRRQGGAATTGSMRIANSRIAY
jgi:hypothetical protein